MRKGGNISIKLTNILKQTQECCNKKKCPKGTKRCKPKKNKSKKDDDEGLFGGMPNIRPTSRAIPMPQSVMNNITPVPNIPLPTQLPAYSQFRRPHAMYQRNDRPLQVQQGRGIRQPERKPLMVSSGIQTARRQALTMQQLPPISVQRPPISKTRGVMTDREIRGRQGTADQPFNAPVPTPNILDYEGILMRNAEADRRLAQRRREEMSERYKSTLKDIGQGTPRVDREDTPQEESVKRLIAEEVAINQGRPGFVDDRVTSLERRPQIDDEPTRRRRGRPTREEQIEAVLRADVAERRQNLEEQGVDTSGYTTDDIFQMPDDAFTFPDRTSAGGASFV